MNQILGNENLKPANSNRFSVYYNSYDMLKGKYIYGNVFLTQNNSAIQQNVTIFPGGRREMYYDNADQAGYNGSAWMGGGFDLVRKHQIKADLGLQANLNTYSNYIKDLTLENSEADFQANDNTSYSYNLRIGAYKNTTKNIDFNVNFRPGWTVLKTTLNPDLNSDGFTFNSNVWFKYYLPAKFSLYADLSYEYQAPTNAFPDKFERVLFKPGISRKFLKGENLVVDFYVNDLLKQNTGFRRFQSGNAITQTSYNTISRYFMLKVSWDFLHPSKEENKMKMTHYLAIIGTLMLNMALPASAQHAYFPDQGIITYEKTVHVKNLLKRHLSTLKDNDFSKNYLTQLMGQKVPETAVLDKKLSFNRNEMSFEPLETDQPEIISTLLRMGLLDYEVENLSKLR